jgi:geranylgeranyl pyrophosphate synthase
VPLITHLKRQKNEAEQAKASLAIIADSDYKNALLALADFAVERSY